MIYLKSCGIFPSFIKVINLELQESYGAYVCIAENVHKEFHKQYGYGDNTLEQWNEFVENYKTHN